MSTYDSVKTFQQCPYCGEYQSFDTQTKNLGGMMFIYDTYKKDPILDRTKLPVFKKNPFDRSSSLWKSQDERRKENARVPDEYKNIKFIEITSDCHSIKCQFDADRDDIIKQGCPSGFGRMFHGKILIKDGLLVGDIVDIKKDDLTEKKLNRWKTLYPKEYRILMKKHKHEPIATREWNSMIPSFRRLTVDVKKKKITSKLIRFPVSMQPKEILKK
jgi:hypothetical protein